MEFALLILSHIVFNLLDEFSWLVNAMEMDLATTCPRCKEVDVANTVEPLRWRVVIFNILYLMEVEPLFRCVENVGPVKDLPVRNDVPSRSSLDRLTSK